MWNIQDQLLFQFLIIVGCTSKNLGATNIYKNFTDSMNIKFHSVQPLLSSDCILTHHKEQKPSVRHTVANPKLSSSKSDRNTISIISMEISLANTQKNHR
ncbi:hypothetical protein GDO86_000344 [Hymenochirus boettgeri]|uniref:Uncharacterized protein n=1 Tax=Hymenochirus boettgeri TaxID=247094 RepID=A0A8T2KBM3_9PIPI|nr:hypothetical protein GDO86_000344 [Hymenochirus boettgeri]